MNRDGTSSELDRDREDAEDRAQLFVQQVGEALEKLLADECDGLNNPDAHELAPMIAPRVAAAIHAAIMKVNGCHCCADEMGWDEPQKVALAALQGALRGPRADGEGTT